MVDVGGGKSEMGFMLGSYPLRLRLQMVDGETALCSSCARMNFSGGCRKGWMVHRVDASAISASISQRSDLSNQRTCLGRLSIWIDLPSADAVKQEGKG